MTRLSLSLLLCVTGLAVAEPAPPRREKAAPRKAERVAATPAPSPSPSPESAPGTAVSAADERLRQVRERKQALGKELARLRSQEKTLLGEVERLEVEVRLRSEELREVQLGLQKAQAQMDETLRHVQRLDAALAKARPELTAHARALYKLGEMSYLRMLLSVERPADLVRGYRFVSALARRDRELVARFRADLATVQAERAALERETEESLRLRAELEQARRNFDLDRRRKTELLTTLVAKKELQAAYVLELEEAEGRLSAMIGGFAEEAFVSVPLGAFRGSLPWPVEGPIRVGYGKRKDARFETYTRENGIEIAAPEGTPVTAVHEGTVVFAERFKGYGLMVILDHGGKHHSLYAHLAEARVEVGRKVAQGEVLGAVGPGGLEGPGLYLEMRFQGRPEDPVDWLRPKRDR
jgi:septal ring factor EnvC (AmiA/AmiB activator)